MMMFILLHLNTNGVRHAKFELKKINNYLNLSVMYFFMQFRNPITTKLQMMLQMLSIPCSKNLKLSEPK